MMEQHKYYPRSRRELRCAKRRRRHFLAPSHLPALSTHCVRPEKMASSSTDTRCRARVHFQAVFAQHSAKRTCRCAELHNLRCFCRVLLPYVVAYLAIQAIAPCSRPAIFTWPLQVPFSPPIAAERARRSLSTPRLTHGNCISIALCPNAQLGHFSPALSKPQCTSCSSMAKCRPHAMIRS
jgi:hypothetical protein